MIASQRQFPHNARASRGKYGKIESVPIIKSAIKKLRADRKRTKINKAIKSKAVNLISIFRKTPVPTALSGVFSAIDRAAKKRVFHPKKADRLKSRLSRLLSGKK